MTSTEVLAALNIVSFLIGLLVGHRLALFRDKRKEFNDLTAPVRVALYRIRNTLTFIEEISGDDMFLIRERLWFWQRKGFDLAYADYKRSRGSDNYDFHAGGGSVRDRDLIVRSIDALIKYLKIR